MPDRVSTSVKAATSKVHATAGITGEQPFADEQTRVFTTKDVAAGYRLVALIRVDRDSRTVELGWAMLESL